MRYPLLLLLLWGGYCASAVSAEEIQFDTETMKSLGLSERIGDYFAKEARFLPGVSVVNVIVNSHNKGRVEVRFNEQGELCANNTLLRKAGIKDPETHHAEEECRDLRVSYPTGTITLFPNESRIELLLPDEALEITNLNINESQRGGTAGLINYTLLSSRSEYSGQQSDYSQATLNTGINIADWMLRGGHIFTRMDGRNEVSRIYTYAQRSLVDYKTLVQLGEINTNNPLLSGAAIYGIQFSPDNDLVPQQNNAVVIGIANTAQARVEIRQQGTLIYTTLVPAGPFELTNVPVVSTRSDLNVKVTETNGQIRNYTVTAASFMQQSGQPQGYTFSVGKTNNTAGYIIEPWLATGSGGWRINRHITNNAGFLLSEKYQVLATQVEIMPLENLQLTGQLNTSRDSWHHKQGQSWTLAGAYNAPGNISPSVSVSRYTQGYRDFSDALSDEDDIVYTKGDYTASLRWSHSMLGSVSFSYSRSEGFTSQDDSRNISLNWSKNFSWASVSVNWQHQLNNSHDQDKNNFNAIPNDGDTLYVNVSIPLGDSMVNSWMRRNGNRETYGSSTTGNINENVSWNASVDRDQQNQQNNISGGLSANLHYTQMSLNASTSNEDSRNYSASLTGGVALHGNGMTFAPYSLQDTFAIVTTEPALSGVKINSQQGAVWTDFTGRAVIPALSAWQSSRVEIEMASLPKNVDVDNGLQMINQGRGSVGVVAFKTLTQRRVLLNVRLPEGALLPKGVALMDADGNYQTTSADDGVVFLNDTNGKNSLFVHDSGMKEGCRIDFELAEETRADIFYETIDAVCKPMGER
ncbi:fimbrial biogenesis usher protein [Escherichia coli]|uniref:fimbrial biogenesis usher protein n=1 Tax=Escherichia coli TaxID=562 RepID=UPI00148EDCD6|nr:fimbrial biogenesis usher protein [Escherichia coli]QJU26261.1 fimbrial biogenesis usher protein [Escherichia coli]